MKQLVEKIWNYGMLSRQEQEEVESLVLENPEYASVLADSKAVHRLFEEAGVFANDSNEKIAMAYLVAHTQVTSGMAPGMLERAFAELRTKIEAMPHALERYSEVRVRMEEIAMGSDPVSQFEQLTGYDIKQDFAPSLENKRIPQKLRKAFFKGGYKKDRSIVKRRRAAGGAIGMGVGVSTVLLFLVMVVGYYENRIARGAYIGDDVLYVKEVMRERGLENNEESNSPEVLFTLAKNAIYSAQKVQLGLYYSYDKQELEQAETLLIQGPQQRTCI